MKDQSDHERLLLQIWCFYINILGAKCSSMVERLLMVLWVVGLIPHGGPIELVPANAI